MVNRAAYGFSGLALILAYFVFYLFLLPFIVVITIVIIIRSHGECLDTNIISSTTPLLPSRFSWLHLQTQRFCYPTCTLSKPNPFTCTQHSPPSKLDLITIQQPPPFVSISNIDIHRAIPAHFQQTPFLPCCRPTDCSRAEKIPSAKLTPVDAVVCKHLFK